jgi:two-component sensor histidine kinase
MATDQFLPGASPFTLFYPAIMVATLLGGWQAGCLTLVTLFLYASCVLIPVEYGFLFANGKATDWLVLAVASGGTTVILAELVLLAVRRRAQERKEKAERQTLLLREVNHRVKNNFSIVTAFLTLQSRRAASPDVKEALSTAASRVRALAHANDNLYSDTGGDVDLEFYIPELCDATSKALFLPDSVTLTCECGSARMERDRAIAIGLIINELLTNAAKHAFEGRDRGQITVRVAESNGKLLLGVSDDGIGFPESVRDGALGKTLIHALCIQAKGSPIWHSDSAGTEFVLKLEPSATVEERGPPEGSASIKHWPRSIFRDALLARRIEQPEIDRKWQ